jgi:RND family efflux transporter MFP subunit
MRNRTLAVLSILALGVASCDRGAAKPAAAATTQPRPEATPTPLPEVTVKLATVTRAVWPLQLETTGDVEVDERTTLGTKVPGRLVELLVDTGADVRLGDVLAAVDNTDYQLRVKQSEAFLRQARSLLGLPYDGTSDEVDPEATTQVREARAVLEEAAAKRMRAETLRSQGISTDAEVDEAKAVARVAEERLQSAQQEIRNLGALVEQRRAELSIARQQLADTMVRAPYDGVVQARLAGRGDYLTIGSPILTLVRLDPLRLRAKVPERSATSLAVGQQVRFTVEGDLRVHEGVVARIAPELDRNNRSLVIEAEVKNRDENAQYRLRGGLFAQVTVVFDATATALVVPASALRSFAGVERILAVKGGVVEERLVRVGRRDGDRLEVRSGVEQGETIVVTPGNLVGGQRVRAAE